VPSCMYSGYSFVIYACETRFLALMYSLEGNCAAVSSEDANFIELLGSCM
jgi:hypothetical protein